MVISERGYADQSNRLYGALFGRFVAWMLSQGLSLATVTARDIERFLGTLEGRGGDRPTVRTRRTYLSEISRVLEHLQVLGLRTSNPAASLIARARIREPLQERNICLAGVEDLGDRIGTRLRDAALDARAHPKTVRAAALTALALDAGLILKEMQRLTWARFIVTGQGESARGEVNSPGHRTLKGRRLVLSPWATQILQAWVVIRVHQQEACTAGGRIPSDKLQGLKLFAHPLKAHALRDVTIQADVKAALASVGAPEVGPAVLRNEFMASLLRRGLDAQEVADRAGLRDLAQIPHVRHAARIPLRPSSEQWALA